MKAVSYSDGKVCTKNLERPSGEGVLVDVASAGICGSDLHLLNSGAHSPHVAGHEIAGITPNGTHVAIEPIISCRECITCKSGDYHLCKVDFQGMGMSINGGMAEQILVPEECLVSLNKKIPIQDACLVEPLAVALHGFIRTNTKSTHKVAVIGGGTIGMCAIAAAKYIGCEVDLYAKYDHQQEAGNKLGAKVLDGVYENILHVEYDFGVEYEKENEEVIRILKREGVELVYDSHLCEQHNVGSAYMELDTFIELTRFYY